MLEELEAPHGPPKKTPGTCEQGHLLDLHKWQDLRTDGGSYSKQLQAPTVVKWLQVG